MPDLHVPIDVFEISLQLRGTTSASRWTQPFFEAVLRQTNSIWTQAHIIFDMRGYTRENFELLNAGSNLNLSNDADIMFLLSRHRGQHGIGVCLVNIAMTRTGDLLGGVFQQSFRSCFIGHFSSDVMAGINLAHELGHGLIGPGHTGGSTNLMQTHSPARTNTRLNRAQINRARGRVPQILA